MKVYKLQKSDDLNYKLFTTKKKVEDEMKTLGGNEVAKYGSLSLWRVIDYSDKKKGGVYLFYTVDMVEVK